MPHMQTPLEWLAVRAVTERPDRRRRTGRDHRERVSIGAAERRFSGTPRGGLRIVEDGGDVVGQGSRIVRIKKDGTLIVENLAMCRRCATR